MGQLRRPRQDVEHGHCLVCLDFWTPLFPPGGQYPQWAMVRNARTAVSPTACCVVGLLLDLLAGTVAHDAHFVHHWQTQVAKGGPPRASSLARGCDARRPIQPPYTYFVRRGDRGGFSSRCDAMRTTPITCPQLGQLSRNVGSRRDETGMPRVLEHGGDSDEHLE